METTLKELEEQMKAEGKSGYVKVQLPTCLAARNFRIGYFRDCADWHHIDYNETKVQFIEYVGWRN